MAKLEVNTSRFAWRLAAAKISQNFRPFQEYPRAGNTLCRAKNMNNKNKAISSSGCHPKCLLAGV
jgi:hypothetical protein